MQVRRILSIIIGITQSIIAMLVFSFACIICLDLFGVQSVSDLTVGSINSRILALLGLGSLSLVSGLFLVHEWVESR